MDGANAWQRFRHLTLPMLRPTMFTVLTLGLIGTWQVFDQIYTGTQGGPAKTTLTPAYLSFNTAFNNQNWGQGAAIAFILFAIIVVLTLAPAGRPEEPHVSARRTLRAASRSALYGVLVALAVVYILPFLIDVSTSFKTEAEAAEDPLSLIPRTFTTEAYRDAVPRTRLPALVRELGRGHAGRDPRPGALRLARRLRAGADPVPRPGRVFALLVAVMAVPNVVLLIPKFLVINQLGMYDSYSGHDRPAARRRGRHLHHEELLRVDPGQRRGAGPDRRRRHPADLLVDRAADGPAGRDDDHHPVLPGLVERAEPLHRRQLGPGPVHADQGRRSAGVRCARARGRSTRSSWPPPRS